VAARQGTDNSHVLGVLPCPSQEQFTQALREYRQHSVAPQLPALAGLDLSKYRYCLVLSAADRNLFDILQHESPDEATLCTMIRDVAQALQHLHERHVVHGQLKPQHVVRIAAVGPNAGRMRLIDFTASAHIAAVSPSTVPTGAKFSTGYLAPELFCRLTVAQEEQYNEYWAAERETDSDLWHRVRPVYVDERGQLEAYVVRTSMPGGANAGQSGAIDAQGEHAAEHKLSALAAPGLELPYTLVPPSPQIDMWALGAILFEAVTGQPLMKVDRYGNLCDPSDYTRIASWWQNTAKGALNGDAENGDEFSDLELDIVSHITDPAAAHLIAWLLQSHAARRPRSMTEVLKHPYFTVDTTSEKASDRTNILEPGEVDEWYLSARQALHGTVDHTLAASTRIMAQQCTSRRSGYSRSATRSLLCTPHSARTPEPTNGRPEVPSLGSRSGGDLFNTGFAKGNTLSTLPTLSSHTSRLTDTAGYATAPSMRGPATDAAAAERSGAEKHIAASAVPQTSTVAKPATAPQTGQPDTSPEEDPLTGASAAADEDVVQALLAAMHNWEDSYRSALEDDGDAAAGTAQRSSIQRSAACGASVQLCDTQRVGSEGAVLEGPYGVTVELPGGAMGVGLDSQPQGLEVSLQLLQGVAQYAHLPAVAPIVRLTPSNFQFRRLVYVTVPHCLLRATKANLSVCLFDAESGGLRNVIDPNAVEFTSAATLRFPVMFACDVVVVFRDAATTRHLSSDPSSQHVYCAYSGCEAVGSPTSPVGATNGVVNAWSSLVSGTPKSVSAGSTPVGAITPRFSAASTPRGEAAKRVQCRFCDAVYCVAHCAQRVEGQPCCAACHRDSWTVLVSVLCVASDQNSDVQLTMQPYFDATREKFRAQRTSSDPQPDSPSKHKQPPQQVLQCAFRDNQIRCNVQVNLNEREITHPMLNTAALTFKVPPVAVVMVSDVTLTEQEPCQWRFCKA
jgi:serine/threonine protein kinase